METGWRSVQSGVSGQWREETFVLLCLDVSLTLGKLSCDIPMEAVGHVNEGLR